MQLEGSCHCRKVRFAVESETPYPFMYCHCSICRKTSGLFGVNIMGLRRTLRVRGRKHLRVYRAVLRRPGERPRRSRAERWFCGECGTHLYLLDERWDWGVWPNAAAIDTPLPQPPETVQLMLRFKPDWVPDPGAGPRYDVWPELSIADWHEAHGLTVPLDA